MMTNILMFFSGMVFWFWLPVLIVLCLAFFVSVALDEEPHYIAATFFGTLIWWMFYPYSAISLKLFLILLPSYFVIGLIYSLVMWYIECKKVYLFAKNWPMKLDVASGITVIDYPNPNYHKFDSKLREVFFNLGGGIKEEVFWKTIKPNPSEFKALLSAWCTFWPGFLLHFLLHDFIKYIQNLLTNVYSYLTNLAFENH